MTTKLDTAAAHLTKTDMAFQGVLRRRTDDPELIERWNDYVAAKIAWPEALIEQHPQIDDGVEPAVPMEVL